MQTGPGVITSIRIESKLFKRARREAEREHRSFSNLIELLLIQFLTSRKGTRKERALLASLALPRRGPRPRRASMTQEGASA